MILSVREALRKALEDAILNDDKVYLLGEDIGKYGGCCQVTGNLYEKYSDHIIETPVSEEGFSSMAIGMAMVGLRVVVEIMYGDFLTLASDPIINHAAKLRFTSANKLCAPLVYRMPIGSGSGASSQHSQNPEAWFLNVPGIILVCPSDSNSAYHMMRKSIESNNPIIFFEPRILYDNTYNVDFDDEFTLGKARVVKKGNKLTIVSYGSTVSIAKKVSEEIDGIEVIDLLTLKPLDIDTIKKSVLKTKKLIVLQEAPKFGGVGSEVIKSLVEDEKIFSNLIKAPIVIGAHEIPVPFEKNLEKEFKPNFKSVLKEVETYLK